MTKMTLAPKKIDQADLTGALGVNPIQRKALDMSPQTSVAIDDYGYGLVHIAWYLADQARFLMFGFMELYPAEFPAPLDTPEKHLALKRLGRRNRLYVKRICLPAKVAVDWYVRCIQGEIRLPGDLDSTGAPKLLASARFAEELQWPQLIVASDQVPFVPEIWRAPKVHHLLQPEMLPDAKVAAFDPEGRKWLSEQMFIDFDAYAEFLGSLHLIAPDPIFRGVDHGLSSKVPGQEVSVLRFRPRMNKALDGLRAILIDRRSTGIGGFVETEITSTEMEIPHPPGTTNQVEVVVLNRVGSVLSWSRPTGFAQSFAVNVMTPGPQQSVVVPATGSSPESSYTRALAGYGTTVTVGEPRSPKEAIPILATGEYRREMKRLDDRYPERWFHGDREAATKFVRSLISSAKQRLWIVDPYFTTVELVSYALATSSTKLPVLIVTSAEAMKKKDRIDPKRTAAEVLDAQLPNLAKHGNFFIKVLTGTPAVHDRFLVIDDSVWFSGNSLHTIGDRAGMVIKLRNSEDIIGNLNEILDGDRTASWQEWIANHYSVTRSDFGKPKTWATLGTAISVGAIGFWWVFRQRKMRGH
jgi:hypothetical protein